jgi:aspartate aminotransferase
VKGIFCSVPEGTFYTLPNIKATRWPSQNLAAALLEHAGVAALSGTAFGEFGEGYFRFSIANSYENLEKAADRIDG